VGTAWTGIAPHVRAFVISDGIKAGGPRAIVFAVNMVRSHSLTQKKGEATASRAFLRYLAVPPRSLPIPNVQVADGRKTGLAEAARFIATPAQRLHSISDNHRLSMPEYILV
jgi:hypothetical protein